MSEKFNRSRGRLPFQQSHHNHLSSKRLSSLPGAQRGNMPQKVWGSETRENCEPQPLMQGCQVLLGCFQLRLERCQLQIPVCQLMCQLAAWSQSKPPQLLRKAPLQLQAPRCLLIVMLQCQTQKEVIQLSKCRPQELSFSNH